MNIADLKEGDRVRYNTEYLFPQVHEGTGTIEHIFNGKIGVMNDGNHPHLDDLDYVEPESIFEILKDEPTLDIL